MSKARDDDWRRAVNLVANFDQINASRRDGLEALRRASDGLFQMSKEDRREILDDLPALERQLFQEMARELGDARLVDALQEVSA